MQRTVDSRRKKVVGESCGGKPHVRFEVAGDGNQDMVVVLRHSEETESNGSTSPKSNTPFPDPTTRFALRFGPAGEACRWAANHADVFQ